MKPQNIGELIDQMIRLAVKNPKVLNEKSKGKDAIEYQIIRAQVVEYFTAIRTITEYELRNEPQKQKFRINPYTGIEEPIRRPYDF